MIYAVAGLALLAGCLLALLWRRQAPQVSPPSLEQAWERLHQIDKAESEKAEPDAYLRSGLDLLR